MKSYGEAIAALLEAMQPRVIGGKPLGSQAFVARNQEE